LEALHPVFAQIMREHPQVELAIFCGQRPSFASSVPFLHLPWRQGGEQEAVQTFHIGLLPLPTDSFSQGKSPIKALQYMAAGIPTIATPQAGSLEIGQDSGGMLFAEKPDAWHASLSRLIRDAAEREMMGQRARATFEERFASTHIYSQWKACLFGA
jgi:glycosyltransferase involved in cell wall biosynthesis